MDPVRNRFLVTKAVFFPLHLNRLLNARFYKTFTLTLFFSWCLTACSSTGSGPNQCVQPILNSECCQGPKPTCLDELKLLLNPNALKTNPCEALGGVRYQMVQEEALSLGAQAGLAARAKVINCQLEKNAAYLDQAFNFQLLLLPQNILPPVLVEGRHILNLADNRTIRIADRTYLIIQQAKFITAPPHWRQYLFLDYKKPEIPEIAMCAKSREERKVWEKFIIQGWNDGIHQADGIYADNLARLKRDYTGMIRYRTLLAQHMVTPPYVAKTDLGITCDNAGMHVNDQVLRITALPHLCTEPECWRPAIINERSTCATK